MTQPMPRSTQVVHRGPWAWLVLGALIGALSVLLHQWPAQWLAPMVRHLSEDRVQLIEPQGTLWHGSAHLALSSGTDRPTTTAWSQRLEWRLRPLGFGGWHLQFSLVQKPEAQSWSWRLQWHPTGWTLSVSDIDWRLPTAWLTGLGAPWNTLQPDGAMRLRSQGWHWQGGQVDAPSSGQISLTLEGFATRLSSLRPLGDYQLTLRSAPSLRLELSTIQGHLRLMGQGHWHSGRLTFQGEAWADQAQDEAVLSNLLNVLGQRVGPRTLLKVG